MKKRVNISLSEEIAEQLKEVAEKKANNPNPYGISIAEYREQIGEPKVAK